MHQIECLIPSIGFILPNEWNTCEDGHKEGVKGEHPKLVDQLFWEALNPLIVAPEVNEREGNKGESEHPVSEKYFMGEGEIAAEKKNRESCERLKEKKGNKKA